MKIRSLLPKDRAKLHAMLIKAGVFTQAEIDVAMELIDIVLKDKTQKDYQINCMVDDQDQAVGYICFGPAPMTQGTFDLYWIVVDRNFQGGGIGSKLLDFLEDVLKKLGGRMILVDTSSVPEYEKAQDFYLKKGFKEIARVPNYYAPGNDRITLCKRLT
ncbi:MAG: GNAT family N-acetyltransferase [Syntrophaceae bacterium]|nr:GNAT family N-acetyltransferase [Syntrophaceae bacterium]